MITRDYFLRMIQQLAEVFARVLKLSEVKRFDEALEEIQLSSKQLLGMDRRLLTTLSDSEFIRLLSVGDRFDVEKCVVVAELLRLAGEVKSVEGDEAEQYHCTVTSLSLFLELLLRESETLPKEYFDKIELLIGDVSVYDLTGELQQKLFRYYEAVGRYDAAEYPRRRRRGRRSRSCRRGLSRPSRNGPRAAPSGACSTATCRQAPAASFSKTYACPASRRCSTRWGARPPRGCPGRQRPNRTRCTRRNLRHGG